MIQSIIKLVKLFLLVVFVLIAIGFLDFISNPLKFIQTYSPSHTIM